MSEVRKIRGCSKMIKIGRTHFDASIAIDEPLDIYSAEYAFEYARTCAWSIQYINENIFDQLFG